jgi:hypothetical protein
MRMNETDPYKEKKKKRVKKGGGKRIGFLSKAKSAQKKECFI